jgi:hypothetical protein
MKHLHRLLPGYSQSFPSHAPLIDLWNVKRLTKVTIVSAMRRDLPITFVKAEREN